MSPTTSHQHATQSRTVLQKGVSTGWAERDCEEDWCGEPEKILGSLWFYAHLQQVAPRKAMGLTISWFLSGFYDSFLFGISSWGLKESTIFQTSWVGVHSFLPAISSRFLQVPPGFPNPWCSMVPLRGSPELWFPQGIWLVVEPSLWKIWKSVGMMTFPIYSKIKNGNQTTKQGYIWAFH